MVEEPFSSSRSYFSLVLAKTLPIKKSINGFQFFPSPNTIISIKISGSEFISHALSIRMMILADTHSEKIQGTAPQPHAPWQMAIIS
jgi:hypothetical protein